MIIDAKNIDYKSLNDALRSATAECEVLQCLGQRFIAAGMSNKNITINGIPGNALGAYLNGAVIEVMGNAQDAVGDTMNEGKIIYDVQGEEKKALTTADLLAKFKLTSGEELEDDKILLSEAEQ